MSHEDQPLDMAKSSSDRKEIKKKILRASGVKKEQEKEQKYQYIQEPILLTSFLNDIS